MPIEDGRRVSPTIAGIRRDDVARYQFAAQRIAHRAWVLDVACGTGYGSWLMAQLARPERVVGVDICPDAIAYGLRHYAHPRVNLMCADALRLDLGGQQFDLIVSFETLEHIAQDRAFLERLAQALAPGGMLVISTPNQEVLPFNPSCYAHHVRHYTSAEFADLLARSGFALIEAWTQPDRESGAIAPGFGGAFDIAVCVKAPTAVRLISPDALAGRMKAEAAV